MPAASEKKTIPTEVNRLAALSDSKATARCVSLYRYLQETAGRQILLGQQESPMYGVRTQELDWLLRVTGRSPAVLGLDFIHDDYDGVVERSLRWNDLGGIVTICWHTGVAGKGYPDSKTEQPDMQRLMEPGTAEHGLLMRRWTDCAKALERLQRADVPVLWRPFHEFDGGWFWWGKGGAAPFVQLWQSMYRFFTEQCGLHHLIWVLGYADDVLEGWYPGDGFCDVIGSDTYRRETTHADACRRLRKLSADKPLAFHECGYIPPLDAFFRDNAVWSWLMPWHGRYLKTAASAERFRQLYHDPRTVTLHRLPQF